MRRLALISFLLALCTLLPAQTTRFAWLTDIHYSNGSPAEDCLRQCVRDINALSLAPDGPKFVIVSGDITDFGSDSQLREVKAILDSLRVPCHVIPGNHDAKWSESGCNTFAEVFGGEQFEIHIPGYRIIGCASGPDMRMAPALLPRQHIRWLEQMATEIPSEPTIFVNHYQVDSTMLNFGEVRSLLRRLDTRIALSGHMHINGTRDFAGIPGVLSRSTLATSKVPCGYSLVTVDGDSLFVAERRPGDKSVREWYSRKLEPVQGSESLGPGGLTADYPWMDFSVNGRYPGVKELWRLQEDCNIASGFAVNGKRAWYATETGLLRCIDTRTGKQIWTAQLPGKVFSTPAYSRGLVLVGCAASGMYAFDARSGRIKWTVPTRAAVLGSAAVSGGVAYFGASDGSFRAVKVGDGKLLWSFDDVQGFVECLPMVDREQVVFGTWGRKLYSLDPRTGKLQWEWTVGRKSVMYSPAACNPVKAAGRIFVAVPDRKLHVLDAATGKHLATVDGGRESVSCSGGRVFVKSMYGRAYAVAADARLQQDGSLPKLWDVPTPLGYDISPTPALECGSVLLVPSDKGNLFAFDSRTGEHLWSHKVSAALLNPLCAPGRGRSNVILASTLDGVVCAIEYNYGN